jgi:hypothetical protein
VIPASAGRYSSRGALAMDARGRVPLYPRVKSIVSGCSDEFATVLVFSLAGLDLSLWLLTKGFLLGLADLVNVLLPPG